VAAKARTGTRKMKMPRAMSDQPPSVVQVVEVSEEESLEVGLVLGGEEVAEGREEVVVASEDGVGGAGTSSVAASCGVAAGWASMVVWRRARWARWFVGVRSWYGCCACWGASGSAVVRELPAISMKMRDLENCI
jgi:hypothetical protein